MNRENDYNHSLTSPWIRRSREIRIFESFLMPADTCETIKIARPATIQLSYSYTAGRSQNRQVLSVYIYIYIFFLPFFSNSSFSFNSSILSDLSDFSSFDVCSWTNSNKYVQSSRNIIWFQSLFLLCPRFSNTSRHPCLCETQRLPGRKYFCAFVDIVIESRVRYKQICNTIHTKAHTAFFI